MKAELVSIGDEILIGQVINTNAVFLAEELGKLGVEVIRMTAVADRTEDITEAIKEATARADLVLTTGGLGPTSDDVTKETLARFFGTEMVLYPEVLERNKILLRSRGVTLNKRNSRQAMMPENCEILPNPSGTAQGMWFSRTNVTLCALPGVPYEMREIFLREIAPRLKQRFVLPQIRHLTVLTSGLPESEMAQIIGDWEKNLPSHIRLAYLPSPGILRLRLTSTAAKKEDLEQEMERESEKLRALVGPFIFGFNEDKLEQITGELLLQKSLTLSVAESCTGGKVSELITSVPGCSAYFMGSVVAYSNEVKIRELDVSPQTIKNYGAVSEEVVIEMARGALKRFKSDMSIAITGVAGPSGGSEIKPVGTTWIAIASAAREVNAQLFRFGEHRGRNIMKAAITALFMLKKELESDR